jgi:hypothetical protein
VLQLVDDALGSSTRMKTKPSMEVDEKFGRAIDVLRDFKKMFPFEDTEADRK